MWGKKSKVSSFFQSSFLTYLLSMISFLSNESRTSVFLSSSFALCSWFKSDLPQKCSGFKEGKDWVKHELGSTCSVQYEGRSWKKIQQGEGEDAWEESESPSVHGTWDRLWFTIPVTALFHRRTLPFLLFAFLWTLTLVMWVFLVWVCFVFL